MVELKQTKIILINENGEYSVSVRQTEMNMDDVYDLLIKPILHAAGYSEEMIEEYFKKDD